MQDGVLSLRSFTDAEVNIDTGQVPCDCIENGKCLLFSSPQLRHYLLEILVLSVMSISLCLLEKKLKRPNSASSYPN